MARRRVQKRCRFSCAPRWRRLIIEQYETRVLLAPAAVADSYTTPEETLLTINAPGVLTNDTGGAAIAVLESVPAHGTLSISQTGALSYTPAKDYNGTDTFTNRAGDGQMTSDLATVTINVTPVIDVPIAADDSYMVDEDSELKVQYLWANDTIDPAGANFRLVIGQNPAHGYISYYNWKGYISYLPYTHYFGPDSFTYAISDGSSLVSNVATVSITVRHVNHPPVAVQEYYTALPNTPLSVAAPGVLGNDTDVEDGLTAVLQTPPPAAQGAATLNSDGSFVFTPADGFAGTTNFTYGASDGQATTSTLVTIRIGNNQAPTATNDAYQLQEDTPYTVQYWSYGLLYNDLDPNGDTLAAVLLSGPAHGTLNLRANGTFDYAPVANYNGPDSFVYRASDGSLGAQATVKLTIAAVNDAPVATGETYTTAEDVPLVVSAPGLLTNDRDVDGDTLSAWLSSPPAHGTMTMGVNGGFTYLPNTDYFGADSFTYVACDAQVCTNAATVAIAVTSVADAPVAVSDYFTVLKNNPINVASPGVLTNDWDRDGDTISAISISGPQHGSLTLRADGGFLYTPAGDYVGPVQFTYRASDAKLISDETTVTIDVVNADGATARDDTYSTSEDSPLQIGGLGVLTNDAGLGLTAALVAGPQHGTVQLGASGGFTYTPVKGFNGADQFTYRASVGQTTSNLATVALTITPVNDPPVPADDSYYQPGYYDDPFFMASPGVLRNDRDAEGDLLTVAIATPPNQGSVVLNPDGSFLYRPNPNYVQPGFTDSFTYRISDGKNSSTNVGRVTIGGYCWQWYCEDGVLDETYLAKEGSPLIVAAPGVVKNDPDSPWLQATLFSGPSHGKLTLNGNGGFTYIPDPGFVGSDSFQYGASDGFSTTGIGTATIVVSPANPPTTSGPNHAPRGYDGAVNAFEETSYAFQPSDFVMDDPQDVPANVLLGISISSLPNTGSLRYRSSSVFVGQTILVSDMYSGQFVYQPPPNAASSYEPLTSFGFRVIDDGGTASGGTNIDSHSATMQINVTPVNDAPTGVAGQVTTSTTGTYIFGLADFPLNDSIDAPANALKAVKIVTLPAGGSLTVGGGMINPGQSVSKESIAAGDFRFTPVPGQSGFPAASFMFQVQDDGGTAAGGVDLDPIPRTMKINVAIGDYLPSGTDKTIQVTQNKSYYFKLEDFGFSAPNGTPPATITGIKFTSLPPRSEGGFDKTYGSGPFYVYELQAGEIISASDIAASVVRFYPFTSGSPLTRFTFQVVDEFGTDPTPNTITINSVFVNNPPIGSFGDATTLATLPYTFQLIDFSYNFSDYHDYPPNKLAAVKITTLPPTGQLTDGGSAVAQGQFIPVADISAGKFVFTPNSSANTSFTFQVQDDGGTTNGGVDLDPVAQTFYITVSSLNHAPSGSDHTVTIPQNSTYTLTESDFGFTDPDDSPPNKLQFVVITSLPTAGQLLDDSVPVSTMQYIYVPTDLEAGKLRFVPDANASGSPYATFTFQVRDDGGTVGGGVNVDPTPNTLTINVAPANDPPVAISDKYVTNEETSLSIAAPGVLANDTDIDSSTLAAQLVRGPEHGTLTLNPDGSFVYCPEPNYSGPDSFTYRANDGQSDGDATKVVLTVNFVADGSSLVTLISDVNQTLAGINVSHPSIVEFNGEGFFGGYLGFRSSGLWRTDGTTAGTTLISEVKPDTSTMLVVGATLFFNGYATATGAELWKTDGTAAGTILVRDIRPGSASSAPDEIVNVSGTLFFTVDDGTDGRELWKSDGTALGTVLVKDIQPGLASSSPSQLTNVAGTLFFSADDGMHGREPWMSDGTPEGTVLIKDIMAGSGSSWLASAQGGVGSANENFFFCANDGVSGSELWTTDGTLAGTVLVKDFRPGSFGSGLRLEPFVNFNGTLFFSANDGTHGYTLWRSDGTEQGTVLAADIDPIVNSFPHSLQNIDGKLFFSAYGSSSLPKLWISDGTAAGTIALGPDNTDPGPLTAVNGTYYFSARQSGTGSELWNTDGTSSGTSLVKEIRPGREGSFPTAFANVNGILVFAADDEALNDQLWISDGTAEGTTLVVLDGVTTASSNPSQPLTIGEVSYFSATDGASGMELWRSDGTTSGTFRMLDIFAGEGPSSPTYLANVNGRLFFVANDGIHGRELWSSDGTAEGTSLVFDIWPGSQSSGPRKLTNVNGWLFFSADDGTHGTELWKSDGTTTGTVLIKDIRPGNPPRSTRYFIDGLTNVSGVLFFVANDGTHGYELWKSDGTEAGTVLVKDIQIEIADSRAGGLVNFNGTLFFTANDGVNGQELWKSDGTDAGTVVVKDVFPGADSSFARYLTNIDGTLFFVANDGTHGNELWKTNGSPDGTVLVADIRAGSLGTPLSNLTNVSGTLFFRADDGVNGAELWKSDGTPEGTILVKDIFDGSDGSSIYELTNVNGMLMFRGNDGIHGSELWQSDGTATGTFMVADVLTGPDTSFITSIQLINGRLLLIADDGTHGPEPMTVIDINGAPSGVDVAISIPVDAAYSLTTADFQFADPTDAQANRLAAVKVSSLPATAAGTLEWSGVPVSIGQLITAAAIAAGQLQFVPAANANTSTSFTFQVQDDGGTANGGVDIDSEPNRFDINVTNAFPWHNRLNALDVNADDYVVGGDALAVINFINAHGSRLLTENVADGNFYDVNGDGYVSPVDALLIINHMNSLPHGEGEAIGPADADSVYQQVGSELGSGSVQTADSLLQLSLEKNEDEGWTTRRRPVGW